MEINKQYKELLDRYGITHGQRIKKGKSTFRVAGYSHNQFGSALILSPDRFHHDGWTFLTSDDNVDPEINSRYGYIYAIDIIKI